ncbi:MAG: YggS family pyridoxal phosphate-dependent enzyme [Halocynthiibacter sp.]
MSLTDIQTRIKKECTRMGRPADEVALIAVSKMQPNARVEDALKEGHRIFGENRVQEAADKWPMFKESYEGVELHLLGPLQSNKARQAIELFDVIHSVDRLKIAKTLARLQNETGRRPRVFLQINTGKEPQKAGVMPEDADVFVAECQALGLNVIGLMCIPPADEEPSLHFALLAKIAARNGLAELSMGMSGDFERAVALGATYVRVGSAIFGARDYK